METKDRAKNGETGKEAVIRQFTEAKSAMVAALEGARKILRSELLKRESEIEGRFSEGTVASVLSNQGGSGKGRISTRKDGGVVRCNDRELFRWTGIAIKDAEAREKREYLIDLFYNEIDSDTGNCHSQIGHFQFAALLPVPLDKPGESPHQVVAKGCARNGKPAHHVLLFNDHRLRDPNQSLYRCDNSNWTLDDFEPETLVEDFLRFVDGREAKRGRKKAKDVHESEAQERRTTA